MTAKNAHQNTSSRKNLENLAFRYSKQNRSYAGFLITKDSVVVEDYDRTAKSLDVAPGAWNTGELKRTNAMRRRTQFRNTNETVEVESTCKGRANRRLNGHQLSEFSDLDLVDSLPAFLVPGAQRAAKKGTRKQRRASLQKV